MTTMHKLTYPATTWTDTLRRVPFVDTYERIEADCLAGKSDTKEASRRLTAIGIDPIDVALEIEEAVFLARKHALISRWLKQ